MKPQKKINPVDIPLAQGLVLENGTIAIDLPTLSCLEQFWKANKDQLPYACQGIEHGNKPDYMRDYQWVFGPTKASVIETVLRLGQSDIHVCWFDWKTSSPDEWKMFFVDMNAGRDNLKEKGIWTAKDERSWQSRTPENYHGWWRFEGVPDSLCVDEWFGIGTSAEELCDPSMPLAEVTHRLCEQTFEAWRDVGMWELETHTPVSVGETINYWLKEKAMGEDYYGRENEVATGKH
ncbi:hypothetical protein [Pseudomonas kurunegalensis]|uniref:hypothetical protein n=1 Tax=Pseudomonas kurunegalensis TaxID=485880 RepID=UPI002570185C|nr:hypothetical protein [Pseudomonas kurunegalensis]WJD61550.1 hypothetical protein QQ992_21835 [Pseudomonas kurunegalensis]